MNCDQFQKHLERLIETRAKLDDPELEQHAQGCRRCREHLKEAHWLNQLIGLWAAVQPAPATCSAEREQMNERLGRTDTARPKTKAAVVPASITSPGQATRRQTSPAKAMRTARAWAVVAAASIAVGLFLWIRPAAKNRLRSNAFANSALQSTSFDQTVSSLWSPRSFREGQEDIPNRFGRPTDPSGLREHNPESGGGFSRKQSERENPTNALSEQLLARLGSLFGNRSLLDNAESLADTGTSGSATSSNAPTGSADRSDTTDRPSLPSTPFRVSLSWALWQSNGSSGDERDETGAVRKTVPSRKLGQPLTSVQRDVTEALNILVDTLPLPPTS